MVAIGNRALHAKAKTLKGVLFFINILIGLCIVTFKTTGFDYFQSRKLNRHELNGSH